MPFYTLADLPGENGPFMPGPMAGQNQDQVRPPARDHFPGIGHILQQHGPPARPEPEHRGRHGRRGWRGLNGARRARARSPSCDTCGHGGSESDDEWDGGHELVLMLPDGDAYDLWSGDEGGDGEALMIVEVDGYGDAMMGDQPPAYEDVQGPVAAAGPRGRGIENQGNRGVEGARHRGGRRQRSDSRGTYSSDDMWSSASEDRHMYRRRRPEGGRRRRGPQQPHGGEGAVEGQADQDGMGIGPAGDWVDGRRGRDDDYGRTMDLIRRAMRDF